MGRGLVTIIATILLSCSQVPAPIPESTLSPEKIEIMVHDTVFVQLPPDTVEKLPGVVMPGINTLMKTKFEKLAGKRVGLITNQTGVDTSMTSTIDILYNSDDVDLRALFSPEHGIRGSEDAGRILESYIDSTTGLPVYSLHGQNRRMTDKMVSGLDVVVYDIQDIGCRSYTFISTMGLAQETCARNGVEFIVLDRPNPLGGNRIEGRAVDPDQISFVSQFSIPYIYGLTPGELAIYLNEEGYLGENVKADLTVVPMQGWKRDMSYRDTGISWIPTSPHIPHMDSPYYYAMSGILGELGVISEGVGYPAPFHYFGAPWIDPDLLASGLNSASAGIFYRPVVFKPYYGKYRDQYCGGVEIIIRDVEKVNLIEVQFLVLEKLNQLYPEKNVFSMADSSRIAMFDKVVGSDSIRVEFSRTGTLEGVRTLLHNGIDDFRQKAEKYYLYD